MLHYYHRHTDGPTDEPLASVRVLYVFMVLCTYEKLALLCIKDIT